MKYIDAANLSDYAFLNEDTLVYPLRGICIDFHGYTDATLFEKSNTTAKILGEQGIAWVFPYYSVWAWMSPSSQEFNEQVLDAVYQKLGADETVPFVVSGGSMGGLTAFNYLVYGKRNAIGCAVNCPVTDLNRIFIDIPSMRRAILSAHIEKDMELEAVLKLFSPVQFADRLPDIPYFCVFGEKDEYFLKNHMPPLVEKFRQYGMNLKQLIQPGMHHCDLDNHPEAHKAFCDFIVSVISDAAMQ